MESMQTISPLDGRLALAASMVRKGSVVCDVGTDHAYLPIWLLQKGICPSAVACDINEGPLNSARTHAARYGCADRITFRLTDGLRGLDPAALGVQDIVICGMGGELIARIYTEEAYTRLPHVRGILQPMTKADELRAALAREGYRIEDERLAFAAGRIYTCMAVCYDGVSRTPTAAELVLGEIHIRRGSTEPLFAEYLHKAIQSAEKKYRGRCGGELDVSAEKALLDDLTAIAQKEGIVL